MPIKTTATSATTTAAQLVDAANASATSPLGVYVANVGSTTIYLGGSDVTTSNGFPVLGTTSVQLYLQPGDNLWAVATTSTNLRVLQQRS